MVADSYTWRKRRVEFTEGQQDTESFGTPEETGKRWGIGRSVVNREATLLGRKSHAECYNKQDVQCGECLGRCPVGVSRRMVGVHHEQVGLPRLFSLIGSSSWHAWRTYGARQARNIECLINANYNRRSGMTRIRFLIS